MAEEPGEMAQFRTWLRGLKANAEDIRFFIFQRDRPRRVEGSFARTGGQVITVLPAGVNIADGVPKLAVANSGIAAELVGEFRESHRWIGSTIFQIVEENGGLTGATRDKFMRFT